MAFGNFRTLADAMLGLQVIETEELFVDLLSSPVSDAFRAELEITLRDFDVTCSEWAICESLLFPVLRETLKSYGDILGMWSHVSLYDGDQMLGVPDYIIARRSPVSRRVMGQPLALIIEAKKNDFDIGWAQCLSAMQAVQTLSGEPQRVIYGIVSDGFIWRFGKLHERAFARHPYDFSLRRLDELFGALNHVFHLCQQQVLSPATAA